MGNRRPAVEREMWTAERLRRVLATTFKNDGVIVIANREPCRHERASSGGIVATRSASGLVTALEPLVQACSGVWIAHGCGTADRLVVDGRDGVGVPALEPQYRLRRVWLSEQEHQGYYHGFANEGLWPLCHRVDVRPIFRPRDFAMYKLANARFANAACEEAHSGDPLMLVQDYHFTLAPAIIRRRLPRATIATFWHVPWPDPQAFSACPCGLELLEGLLGSTVIGFQTPDDCHQFVDCVSHMPGATVDRRHLSVSFRGHRTLVRAYPISIEYPSRWAAAAPPVDSCRAAIRLRLGLPPSAQLAVGVDRLDYTKGLVEKCLAVEQLLDMHPECRGHFVLAQIAEPSRDTLPAYREIRSRLHDVVARVNARFGRDDYRPIMLLEAHHDPREVFLFLRAADICHVGSLHDGMNLVAKEFVAARTDERGVLVLSTYAGAARQLDGALVIDPYDADGVARTLYEASRMPAPEQVRRMRQMRSVVATFNSYWWAGQIVEDAAATRTERTASRTVTAHTHRLSA